MYGDGYSNYIVNDDDYQHCHYRYCSGFDANMNMVTMMVTIAIDFTATAISDHPA